MLYARALDLLLRNKANGQELTGEMIDEVAYNGTLIIQTIVKNITYQSMRKKHVHYFFLGFSLVIPFPYYQQQNLYRYNWCYNKTGRSRRLGREFLGSGFKTVQFSISVARREFHLSVLHGFRGAVLPCRFTGEYPETKTSPPS